MSDHDRCLKEVAARPHCARFRRDAALETQSRKLGPRTPSRARQSVVAAVSIRPTGTPAGRMEECTDLRSGQQQRSAEGDECDDDRDRKSTRLNSSHVAISYAVFCLK